MNVSLAVSAFADRVRDRLLDALPVTGPVADAVEKALTIFVDRNAISQKIYEGAIPGLGSNVVMAPVMWAMRTFCEATAVVQKRSGDARLWDRVTDHELEMLMEQPNDWYDGDALWKATVMSFALAGNAYWIKVRNRYGDVVQLWYAPHWMMTPMYPMAEPTPFISYYQYITGAGGPVELAPRDVVHFRFGLDPTNPRLGLSPLASLWREIEADDDAAAFSQKILANMGVPGMIISPKIDSMRPDKSELAKLQNYMQTAFVGERRGMPLVLGNPTEVTQFGFDPTRLILPDLRDISEERVCAALGIPAAVVGFGSGLQSTKVGATMRELRRLAWVQSLIPMQKTMARQVTAQLLSEFQARRRQFRVWFDTTDVSGFSEEDDAKAVRYRGLVTDGVLRVDRAQAALGLQVDKDREVYLGPAPAPLEVPKPPPPGGALGAPPLSPRALPNARARVVQGNGNGSGDGADPDTKALRAIAARWGFL